MQTTSLIVDVRHGEALKISGSASIELVHKSGQLVRLRVTAPLDVVVSKNSATHAQSRGKHAVVEPG